MTNANSNVSSPLVACRTRGHEALKWVRCFAWLLGNAAWAQTNTPGALDATFIKGAGADGFVRVVAVQPNGKVLLGGNFSTVRGFNNALITRLNSDGTSDPGFTSAFLPPILDARIYMVGVQTDARLLVAGMFTGVGVTFRTNIARLRADGSHH